VEFLLITTELFSCWALRLRCYERICIGSRKWPFLKGVGGSDVPKFQVEGDVPHKLSFFSEKLDDRTSIWYKM